MAPLADHGTRGTYKTGCRCTPCKAANAAYQGDRRARLAKSHHLLGQRVPAAPAWRLIDALRREGFTTQHIAALMGWKRPIIEIGKTLVAVRTLCRLKRIYRVRYLE